MHSRAYIRELLAWLVVYAVLLLSASWALDGHVVSGSVPRAIVALLPMVPGTGVLIAVMREFRRIDELQRQIQADGIMFAFGATALITFSYGFLERFNDAPSISYFWVWPVLGSTWFVGAYLARLRYK